MTFNRGKIKFLCRRFLKNRLATLLRWRSEAYQFQSTGVSLIFAPHQDDECLGCGGLILRKCLNGNPVHVAYITDGSASHPGHPTMTSRMLTERRASEAKLALAILAVKPSDLHFIGVTDGTLAHLGKTEMDQLESKVSGLLKTLNPEEIFLPHHQDGSSEHEAANQIIKRAVSLSGINPRVLEYIVWAWWSPKLLLKILLNGEKVLRLSYPGQAGLKYAALKQYRSQVDPTVPWTSPVLSSDFVSFFVGGEEFYFDNGS
ncbi:MAG TPA: PIG-L family deacetylase [Opitutaceae bacterium]|nr:PIG-L family deacetylase [Opitutaceae bacterium]